METKPQKIKTGFAQLNANGDGFTAFPRWFGQTDFWRSLPAAHRAVLFELFHEIARLPVKPHKASGEYIERGQWITTEKALAKASGASLQQVRATIRKAVREGIIQHKVLHKNRAGSTLHFSLFSWREFNTYDLINVASNTTPNITPNTTVNTTPNITANTTRIPGTEYPSLNTQGEDAPLSFSLGQNSHDSSFSTTSMVKRENGNQSESLNVAKPPKLTDPEKLKICSSMEEMGAYLRAYANWREFRGTATDPNADQWSVKHFVAYYWFRVSSWRAANNMPLTLPIWNKLEEVISGTRDGLTAWNLYCYIGCVIGHFDLLCWRLGKAGKTMMLNESSLAHGLLRNAADALSRLTDEQIAGEYQSMQAAVVVAAA